MLSFRNPALALFSFLISIYISLSFSLSLSFSYFGASLDVQRRQLGIDERKKEDQEEENGWDCFSRIHFWE